MNKLLSIFAIFLVAIACNQKPEEVQTSENLSIETHLESWTEGPSKSAIEDFIQKTTSEGSPEFLPENQRIAVFDNDGTLWAEQPFYFQLFYALDYIKKEAPNHPEWSKNPLVNSVLTDDMPAILKGGEKSLAELVMLSHAGMTEEQFATAVNSWLQTAKHPDTGKPFNKMIYRPMVELLEYFRANGYKTFIVSGGGIDFIRVWAEEAYGIPPYQVVGSSLKAAYSELDGTPQISKLPELNFYDDKAGKPVGIHQHIGMRPTIAVGNSDGDYEMLEYTTNGKGPRLGIYIHHTDSVREYAYDSLSHIGNLKRGLVDAPKKGWIVVDMAKEWSKIYPD